MPKKIENNTSLSTNIKILYGLPYIREKSKLNTQAYGNINVSFLVSNCNKIRVNEQANVHYKENFFLLKVIKNMKRYLSNSTLYHTLGCCLAITLCSTCKLVNLCLILTWRELVL